MSATVATVPVRTRRRVHPLVSLAAGVALYLLLPALLLPLLAGPIDAVLRPIGLLGASASSWEQGFAAGMVLRWVSVALLLLYVVLVEGEPLSSIGIRVPRPADLLLAVVVGLVAVGAGTGLYVLVHHGAGVDKGTQIGLIFATLGIAGRAQVAINAAVVEEAFFRGLLVERVIWLTGRPWLAAATSLVLFVGSHYVTGSSSLLLTLTGDLVGGIALVALYMLRRNLVTNTLAHAVLNLYVVVGA